MQDANIRFNLCGERVQWLFMEDFKYVLPTSKYPLNHKSKTRVSEIEQLLDNLKIVLQENSLTKCDMHIQHILCRIIHPQY